MLTFERKKTITLFEEAKAKPCITVSKIYVILNF